MSSYRQKVSVAQQIVKCKSILLPKVNGCQEKNFQEGLSAQRPILFVQFLKIIHWLAVLNSFISIAIKEDCACVSFSDESRFNISSDNIQKPLCCENSSTYCQEGNYKRTYEECASTNETSSNIQFFFVTIYGYTFWRICLHVVVKSYRICTGRMTYPPEIDTHSISLKSSPVPENKSVGYVKISSNICYSVRISDLHNNTYTCKIVFVT